MKSFSKLLIAALIMSPGVSYADIFVAPFGGYSFGTSDLDVVDNDGNVTSTLKLKESNNYGVMLGTTTNHPGNMYFLYSRQNSEIATFSQTPSPVNKVDVSYYHLGGTLFLGRDAFKPYVTASAGATQLSPDQGFSNETRFSMAIGGGLTYDLTDNFSVFAEVKGFATLFNSSSTLFCDSTRCAWNIKGNVMWQSQANAGVSFRF
ncbi:porin family protein [Shewanella sp. WXL01]|uniref:outer membrane protein n=1 Tax=Shewanella sp. WXL01 TaxID=2709721 RepID=UPI001438415A|nr:outer membrane beta-barrel protein [Shewanella sp. WXL01]NKF49649.1 porin family protein [Shewanella sp. WXL01]